MTVVGEVHLVVAFLVGLCALLFSWNSTGRRVMNAITGLQVVIGLVFAGMMGAAHEPLPRSLWLHVVTALAAMGAYIAARRIGDRAGGSKRAAAISVLGVVLVLLTIYLGLRMAYPAWAAGAL